MDACKYLGITISSDMIWSKHIDQTVKKANSRLGFFKRNLRKCPSSLRRTAYVSMVRPLLEYSCTVWDPNQKQHTTALESVQRRSARWIKADYRRRSSVDAMLADLELSTLEKRRYEQHITLMYKIIYGNIQISKEDLNLETAISSRHTTHSQNLRQLNYKTSHLEHSFTPKTIRDWNSLPASMAEASSLESFKGQLATPSAV